MLRRVLIPIVVGATLALPSIAMATTAKRPERIATARSGTLTATLRYSGRPPLARAQTLTISRSGKIVYRGSVTAKPCGHQCAPSFAPSQPPLQIVALEHAGNPDVLLNLYTGGAHCCSLVQVFSARIGHAAYALAGQHDFGDPGARLEDILHNGQHDFVTANDAFAYEFTDFAASGLPVQVLQYHSGSFLDVTPAFRGLVRKDATSWLTAYKQQAKSHWADSVGVIAAWAADEFTLGRSKQALTYLYQQAHAGHLNSSLSPQEPGGLKFVAKLKTFLHAQGYLS